MPRRPVLAVLVAIFSLRAASSQAQAAEARAAPGHQPPLELGGIVGAGGGAGGVGMGAGVRVTANLSRRNAGELLLMFDGNRGLSGGYTLQYKRIVRPQTAARLAIFVTAGASGSFMYARVAARQTTRPDHSVVAFPAYTDAILTRPDSFGVGVGVQRAFARYGALRAEVFGGIGPAGGGIAALGGLSVPIGGRYAR